MPPEHRALIEAIGLPVMVVVDARVVWLSPAEAGVLGPALGERAEEVLARAPPFLQPLRRSTLRLGEVGVELVVLGDPSATPQQLARERRDMAAQEAISRILREAADERELVEGVLRSLVGLTSLGLRATAGFFVVDPDTQRLRLAHQLGDFPVEACLRGADGVPLGECLCGRAALSGEVQICVDSVADPRHAGRGLPELSHGHYIIPLKASGRVLGVVVLYTSVPPDDYRARRELLADIGAAVGQALAREQAGARLRQRADELVTLATRDGLTGTWNRRETERRLGEALHDASVATSVVLLDVDHFKAINDSHGHAVGDQVLAIVAARLQGICRVSDVLGRWGGEEFLLVLPQTDGAGARGVAERGRRVLAEAPIVVGAHEIRLTASFGVATRTSGAPVAADALLLAADRALYAAKDAGRDRVVVLP